MSNSRLVYSTDDGDRRGDDPREQQAAQGPPLPNEGVIRVFREKGGRRGKTVTVVRGLAAAETPTVASDLKRHCGTGGAVKDGAVEIQGDHRERIAEKLRSAGHTVKLAGG